MNHSNNPKKETTDSTTHHQANDLPGYKIHPVSEDVYNQLQKSKHEDITENVDEDDLMHEQLSEDLDVPGSELDDEDELTGSEDEENNYYSLGGDEHTDLDEHDGDEN